MISCDSLPDIHWFYYCYIVIHRRGDTSPHLLLFYRISWVYRRVSPLLWTIQAHVSQLGVGARLKAIASFQEIDAVKMWNRGVFVKKRGKRKTKPPMGTASYELGIIHSPSGGVDNKNTEYKKNSSPPTGGKLYADEGCGENRIRTCEPVLPVTRFPGVPLQPLEHLSFSKNRCKITENIVCRRMLPIIIMKN